MKKPKIPKIKIAKILGIARSTLYEELKRGTVEQIDTNLKPYKKYYADVGQRVYMHQRQNSRNPLKLVKAIEFIRYAEGRPIRVAATPYLIKKLSAVSTFFWSIRHM